MMRTILITMTIISMMNQRKLIKVVFQGKKLMKNPYPKKESAPKEKAVKSQSKITPISKSSRKQGAASMEVCVIKPSSIEDEIEITETLLNGRTVVINMEGLNVDTAQRIIDFTSGSTYALHGNLQKISNFIFLATLMELIYQVISKTSWIHLIFPGHHIN